MRIFILSTAILLSVLGISSAQQRPDTTFSTGIDDPNFTKGEGPQVCMDSAHNSRHTIDNGFAAVKYVLKEDGYSPVDFTTRIKAKSDLNACDIYLTVNPLHESNIGDWALPNPPVFSAEESDHIIEWVKQGGSLFLIVDHMPYPGAASILTSKLGFSFSNGFARLRKEEGASDVFSKENGRLKNSPITKDIETLTSFTGSAFKYPEGALPIMIFKEGDVSLEPEVAWQFTDTTHTVDINGYAQGVIMELGKGRIAVFGEAAMFTAQTVTNDNGIFRVGINNPRMAPNNLQFLRNVFYWLSE
jgi:hypothetical protein